jgi:NAD(P)-dependent dehydrogenase (short-subunit alcohol dehydrogenase family)
MLGSVDILINNAASMAFDEDHPKSSLASGDAILGSSAAIFDRVFSVNARSTFLMMREFASRFVVRRAQRGS